MTKRQKREYREYLGQFGRPDLVKLRTFLSENGYPEDREEKIEIVEEEIHARGTVS